MLASNFPDYRTVLSSELLLCVFRPVQFESAVSLFVGWLFIRDNVDDESIEQIMRWMCSFLGGYQILTEPFTRVWIKFISSFHWMCTSCVHSPSRRSFYVCVSCVWMHSMQHVCVWEMCVVNELMNKRYVLFSFFLPHSQSVHLLRLSCLELVAAVEDITECVILGCTFTAF